MENYKINKLVDHNICDKLFLYIKITNREKKYKIFFFFFEKKISDLINYYLKKFINKILNYSF